MSAAKRTIEIEEPKGKLGVLIPGMGAVATTFMAGVEAVRRRALTRTLASSFSLGKQWVLFGRAGVAPTLESPGVMSVPYGVAIAIGSLVWWFLGGATL